MKKLLLLLFSITLSFNVSSNEDLSKYETLGLKTVVAFKCANMLGHYEFSEKVGKDWSRLFDLGMESGTALLEGMRSGLIGREFMNKHVPLLLSMRINDAAAWGFSNDFILGGLFEELSAQVYKEVGVASVRRINAKDMYLKNNCALLGN